MAMEFKEAEIRLIGKRTPMGIGMMMSHQSGKGLTLTDISLLEIDRLFVPVGSHI